MQLVGQCGSRSTVTVKKLVAVLPHWSTAVAVTVVIEFAGKQVVSGGLNVSGGLGWPGQQRSVAKALYDTVVQLVQV
jgi:hypothetical protein